MPAAATLKAKTAPAHRRAEVALDAAAIRAGNYSLLAYQRLIRANHASWKAAANWFGAHFEPAAFQEDYNFIYQQLSALERDLNLLGVTSLPTLPLSFSGTGQAELLGLLYVLRGSTLGGTMIARMLPASPELAELDAFHFYLSCGEQPAGHWKVFQARLNDTLKEQSEREKAVAAATMVFNHLHDGMKGH